MTDVQVCAKIVDELRTIIGGPRSLTWPAESLIRALAMVAGRMGALTLRPAQEVAEVVGQEYERAKAVPLAHNPHHPLISEIEIGNRILLGLALPAEYKKPSQMVLTAVCSVLGQLGKAQGTALQELERLVMAGHATVTAAAVDDFQRRSLAARSN